MTSHNKSQQIFNIRAAKCHNISPKHLLVNKRNIRVVTSLQNIDIRRLRLRMNMHVKDLTTSQTKQSLQKHLSGRRSRRWRRQPLPHPSNESSATVGYVERHVGVCDSRNDESLGLWRRRRISVKKKGCTHKQSTERVRSQSNNTDTPNSINTQIS